MIDVDAIVPDAEGVQSVALGGQVLLFCGYARVSHEEFISSTCDDAGRGPPVKYLATARNRVVLQTSPPHPKSTRSICSGAGGIFQGSVAWARRARQARIVMG